MFGFNHSKGVGAGEPVPAMMQRESTGPGSMHTPGDGPPVSLTAHAGAQEGIEFKVRYSLAEYVVFMWQHSSYLIRRRRFSGLPLIWMAIKSTFSAALNFVMQGRSRHIYEFQVDTHGIVRTNSTGVTLVPWGDVVAIRRYTRGFMMVLKRGTLPIPFRCLDEAQRSVMSGFAEALRHGGLRKGAQGGAAS